MFVFVVREFTSLWQAVERKKDRADDVMGAFGEVVCEMAWILNNENY